MVTYVLELRAFVGLPCLPILAVITPIMEARRPRAAYQKTVSTLLLNPEALSSLRAITSAAAREATFESKRSAPIPATSPTLSPTLSATTAGFLGSSSGIPSSTLPVRSAAMSAVFVKIPPPTLANNASELAPKLKQRTACVSLRT